MKSFSPNFLKLWAGQILSQSCGRMYQIAMVWWILERYSSGFWIGVFMVVVALPSLLLVKKIGRIVDRTRSRRVLVTSDILAGLTLIVAAQTVAFGSMELVLVIGFVSAVLQAFIDPTLNKAVNEVVEKEKLEGAVGLLASTQSVASFTGAMFGAGLIDRLGIEGTILLASLGYFAASVMSALTVFKPVATPTLESEAVEGFKVLNGYPLLKRILIGFAAINFFATPTLVVLPVYVKQALGESATTLGFLEAALWLGLILGSLSAKHLRLSEDRLKVATACLAVFGTALAMPGLVVAKGFYAGTLFVAGAALGVNNAKFIAYFQEVVDPALKGRFFALMQATIGATFPIAYFLFGALTDYVSAPMLCLFQGSAVVLVSFYFVSLGRANERHKLAGAL